MMIQSAPAGEAHFLCSMREHNAFCGQLARAFGNADFAPIEPFDRMLYVISHHDYGWDEFDAAPELDPQTGLPRGIGASGPAKGGSETGRRSAQVNEDHDPYCGLLASMHSWGLYNARYGVSEFRVRQGGSTSIPMPPVEPARSATEAMLSGEEERQARLKAAIAADPGGADLIDDAVLMRNYKQLQFFDTLALYFHLRHETDRDVEDFVHVPKNLTEDAAVTVTPKGEGVYAFAPFPFKEDGIELACSGRYLTPFASGDGPDDLATALAALPPARQAYRFVKG